MALGFLRRFRRDAQPAAGESANPSAPPLPEVGFAAFADDCRLRGRIRLTAARLSDMLNGADALALAGVRVEVLADGRSDDIGELTVERDELCAVVADGPRGDVARRLHTRTTRVEIDIGPYHIDAALHGTPASDPLHSILRRPAFVPLTDVTISYRLGGEEIREVVPALLLNRTLARSFRAAQEEHAVFP